MKKATINKHIANVNRLTKLSQKMTFDAAATVRISKVGVLTFIGVKEQCQYVVSDGIQNLAGETIYMTIENFVSIWKRDTINAVDIVTGSTAKLITDAGIFEVDRISADDAPVLFDSINAERHSYFDTADDLPGYADLVGNDDLRPAMNGVFVGNKDNAGYVCATNAHYLRYGVIEVMPNAPDIILPANVVQSLPKNWQGRIDFDANQKLAVIELDIDGYLAKITCRTYDEKYPEFLKVIPQDNKIAACIFVDDALKALKIAETVNHVSQFAFVTIGNKLHLHAQNVDTGKRYFSNPIGENYPDFGEYRQAFNAKYLQTILKNTGQKYVNLYADTPNRGATIGDKLGPYLLMPVYMDLDNLNTLGQ